MYYDRLKEKMDVIRRDVTDAITELNDGNTFDNLFYVSQKLEYLMREIEEARELCSNAEDEYED